jgi:hypothetical protein
MILYTENQLLIAYTRYVREPTIEEFRIIYETEHENQLWDRI